MEIIFEFFSQFFLAIFQMFGEVLLQIIFEAFADLIGHSIKEPFRRPKPINPYVATIGYFLYGLVAGAISLWLVPHMFIHSEGLRKLNLVLSPVASGAIMAWIGFWRRKNEKNVIRIETFSYAFCFAFSMALFRYYYGQ